MPNRVDLESVSKRYLRGGAPVLDDISLTLQGGTSTSITGSNGSGKSTLLRLLAGYLQEVAIAQAFAGEPASSSSTNREPVSIRPRSPCSRSSWIRRANAERSSCLLHLGDNAVVRVTGLRNPCRQINGLEPGLLHQVLGRSESGAVERKGGVMAVVVAGGAVSAGADIRVELPPGEPIALTPV